MVHTLHTMHLSLACLSSPLLLLKNHEQKKAAGTSHKKVFRMKTSACRDGTLKNQPNKMGTTPQHIYTIPTSCAILPTMHNKKLSTCSLNEHGTQHCSLHSLEYERQSIPDSATFSSNKIPQHNLKLPTYHADPALLTVSAYKRDYTCHAQQQLHWLQSILYSNQMLYWKKADVLTANSAVFIMQSIRSSVLCMLVYAPMKSSRNVSFFLIEHSVGRKDTS